MRVFVQKTIKDSYIIFYQLMKLTINKEIVIIPLLFSIIISLSISNSINNQQVVAQDDILGGPTTTESSVQSLGNASLVYESPVYGIRTQYPGGWDIIIQNTSNSLFSLRFNTPLENDTDSFRENVRLVIGSVSNNTALSNFTSATLTSYLELYPDLELIELSSTNLTSSAIPAYKLVGSRTQEGTNFMQILTIKEGKVYSIIYSSEKSRYSTYLPIIEEMINSFEVAQ
jgi:PsbP-like protein